MKMSEEEAKAEGERIMNWILPGLQLFYRDTDEELDVENTFKVGGVIRAGYFIDVSPYAGKPMHKYRYIIASSHAARLCEEGEKYPLHTLHFNSYFKIMDIYKKEGVTQIFLLHIPAKAINSPLLGSTLSIQINGMSFVEIARKSLDTKFMQPIRENLEEKEWLERTEWHVGVDENGVLQPLTPSFPKNYELLSLSKAIRVKASDTDDINIGI